MLKGVFGVGKLFFIPLKAKKKAHICELFLNNQF